MVAMFHSDANLVVLVVSLLVGGLAIHFGAAFALKGGDYTHAVVTAALGGVAWWLVGLAMADLEGVPPAVASFVALAVWVWVIRRRYRAGWVRAALIGLFAWLAALFVLAVLASGGIRGVDAYGVPV